MAVALVAPLSGPLGLAGPSSLNCALLAVEELNAADGIHGRPVELVLVDGGRGPDEVADSVRELVTAGRIDAVVGMHTSAVRTAVVDVVTGQVPYVYTPPYEGGERSAGVFLCGETPTGQLRPAISWLVRQRRARRWALLGNDYIWPRQVHRAARGFLSEVGATVVAERYLPFGVDDFASCLSRLEADAPDALLLSLVGDDLARFHQQLAASPLAHRVIRLSASLEENILLAMGGDNSGKLFATMGYFGALQTDANLAFAERYEARFGAEGPVLNVYGESCYEGLNLLSALAQRSLTLHPIDLSAASEGASFQGARGKLTVHRRHVAQTAHLAVAEGLQFRIVTSF
ncbi:MAG: substrate-binding domain-containing protein [Jatrophihabitantaceae bacterium]